MKNIALLGFGNIGKNYYKNSLQKNFLIKKILRKKKIIRIWLELLFLKILEILSRKTI